MMANGYSQLPVMTSPHSVRGMISWESIGKRLSLGLHCESVKDCMEEKFTVVEAGDSLLSAIKKIEEDEYILVRDAENK